MAGSCSSTELRLALPLVSSPPTAKKRLSARGSLQGQHHQEPSPRLEGALKSQAQPSSVHFMSLHMKRKQGRYIQGYTGYQCLEAYTLVEQS